MARAPRPGGERAARQRVSRLREATGWLERLPARRELSPTRLAKVGISTTPRRHRGTGSSTASTPTSRSIVLRLQDPAVPRRTAGAHRRRVTQRRRAWYWSATRRAPTCDGASTSGVRAPGPRRCRRKRSRIAELIERVGTTSATDVNPAAARATPRRRGLLVARGFRRVREPIRLRKPARSWWRTSNCCSTPPCVGGSRMLRHTSS